MHHPENFALVVLDDELCIIVVAGEGPRPGDHAPHVGVDELGGVEADGEGEPLGLVGGRAARVRERVGED